MYQLLTLMSFLRRVSAVSHELPSAVFLLDKHLKNVVAPCVGQVQSLWYVTWVLRLFVSKGSGWQQAATDILCPRNLQETQTWWLLEARCCLTASFLPLCNYFRRLHPALRPGRQINFHFLKIALWHREDNLCVPLHSHPAGQVPFVLWTREQVVCRGIQGSQVILSFCS